MSDKELDSKLKAIDKKEKAKEESKYWKKWKVYDGVGGINFSAVFSTLILQ